MGKLATCRAVSNTYPYNDQRSIFKNIIFTLQQSYSLTE